MTDTSRDTFTEPRDDHQTQAPDPLSDPMPVDQAGAAPDDGERLSTAELAGRGREDSAVTETRAVDTPPLIADAEGYLSRWKGVQTAFVDEPRSAVQDADALVAEVIQKIAETFAGERNKLEQQWSGGADVGTEELRIALQRYRSFFERLLQT